MAVRSMLMSLRDSVRRGRWRPLVWTLTNGGSMCSHTQVSAIDLSSTTPVKAFNVKLRSFLAPPSLILYSRLFFYFLSSCCPPRSVWLIRPLFMRLFKAHRLTLPSTRPSWSPMEESWDWTFLMEVTWHMASWRRKRKSQRLPSSLSPCRIRYKAIARKDSSKTWTLTVHIAHSTLQWIKKRKPDTK